MTERKVLPRNLWVLSVPVVMYGFPWVAFYLVHFLLLPFHSSPATAQNFENVLIFFLTPFLAIIGLSFVGPFHRPISALILGITYWLFCGTSFVIASGSNLPSHLIFLQVGTFLPAVIYAILDRNQLVGEIRELMSFDWVRRERKILPTWVWVVAAPFLIFLLPAIVEGIVFFSFEPTYWNPRDHSPAQAERENLVRCITAFASPFIPVYVWSSFTPFLRTFGALIAGAIYVVFLFSGLGLSLVNLGKWTVEGGALAISFMAFGLLLPVWIWSGFERQELTARWIARRQP